MKDRHIVRPIIGLIAVGGIALWGVQAAGQLQLKPENPGLRMARIDPIVQRTTTLTQAGGHTKSVSIYRVPLGMRLKIEQLSGHAEMGPGGNYTTLYVATTAGKVTASHEIEMGPPKVPNPPLSGPSSHFHAFTTMVSIYADPGSEVVVRFAGTGSGVADLNLFTLAGRLEPVN